MSRNKRALLLCLMLLLPLHALGAQESDSLISLEDIREEKVNYDTLVIEPGEFARTVSASGKEFYPFSYNLCFEKSGAKFVEYKVRKGDEVKAGDILAEFQMQADEVALATQRLNLQRAKEALESGIESRMDALEALEERRLLEKDPFEREQLALQIAYQQLSLEKYIYQQENSIQDMQDKLETMEEESSQCYLLAPADGVLTSVKSKREGDAVSPSEVLIQMSRTDGMLLQLDNSSGFFRYGMDVIVEVGPVKSRTVFTGKVVGADQLLPKSQRTNKAYILLDAYDAENIKWINVSISGELCRLENIVVLSRNDLVMEAGKHYVKKLEDGMARKRFVQYFNSSINPTQAWIVQGLEPGEVIVTN